MRPRQSVRLRDGFGLTGHRTCAYSICTCAVYGRVCGDVHLTDTALVISGEEICNDSLDTLVMDGKSRSVIRDSSRDELAPQQPPPPTPQKQKGREMSR